MDMSFLIKSFLPPGVSVEQLTQTAQEIAAKVVAAAQRIEQTHQLLTEQNAMLRQIIAASQQQSFNNPQDTPHDTLSTPDDAASPAGSIDGIRPLGTTCAAGTSPGNAIAGGDGNDRTNSYPAPGAGIDWT